MHKTEQKVHTVYTTYTKMYTHTQNMQQKCTKQYTKSIEAST